MAREEILDGARPRGRKVPDGPSQCRSRQCPGRILDALRTHRALKAQAESGPRVVNSCPHVPRVHGRHDDVLTDFEPQRVGVGDEPALAHADSAELGSSPPGTWVSRCRGYARGLAGEKIGVVRTFPCECGERWTAVAVQSRDGVRWMKVHTTDLPVVGGYRWAVNRNGYARRVEMRGNVIGQGPQRSLLAHCEIVGDAPVGLEVDHVDGDKLDNRRCRLALVTHAANMTAWHARRLAGAAARAGDGS